MVVSDVSTWNASSKYSCFIGGDNPWTVIENPTRRTAALASSSRNPSATPLFPSWFRIIQKVYVVDYRYISKVSEE